MLFLKCHNEKCNETIEFNNNNILPDKINEEIMKLGWFVDNRGTICPKCKEIKNESTIRETTE